MNLMKEIAILTFIFLASGCTTGAKTETQERKEPIDSVENLYASHPPSSAPLPHPSASILNEYLGDHAAFIALGPIFVSGDFHAGNYEEVDSFLYAIKTASSGPYRTSNQVVFDNLGRVSQRRSFPAVGLIDRSFLYEDDSELPYLEISRHFNSESNTYYTLMTEYFRDEYGNVTSYIFSDSRHGSRLIKMKFIEAEEGTIVIQLDSENQENESFSGVLYKDGKKSKIFFHENINLDLSISENREISLLKEWKYTYHSNGELESYTLFYYEDGIPRKHISSHYFENGFMERQHFSANNIVDFKNYEYDENMNWIKRDECQRISNSCTSQRRIFDYRNHSLN